MRRGVLVMAYGTPERLEDVERYYTHIRRGSPPPPELLAELVARYEAVGGPTALNRITRAQADGIARALARRGHDVSVYTGFKHVPPFVGDAVARMAAEGVEAAVGLVLAPHYSLRSIAEYERYAEDARPPSLALDVIRSWHDDPGLVAFLAARLRDALARSERDSRVVFTAHSVPEPAASRRDPYAEQLLETCELVAKAAGLDGMGVRLPERGPHRGPVAGAGRSRDDRNGRRARLPRRGAAGRGLRGGPSGDSL